MALACRPAPAPLADGNAVAGVGASTWLDTAPPDVFDAVEAPGAGWVTPALVAETAPATAWVVAGGGPADADELVLSTDVADGPSVGKFGSAKATEAVPPWPAEGSPTLTPRLAAMGAPISRTTTSEATATAPLAALIAVVSLRRRRERLGLTAACPPRGPE
jgi:uncharacterized protein (TIGR03382 family)